MTKPVLAVIGSGMQAMAVISSVEDIVRVGRLEVVWIVPHQRRNVTVFAGNGWNQAPSVEYDPAQTTLLVSRIFRGQVEAVTKDAQGRKVIICAGEGILCDAVVVALNPFCDMESDSGTNFLEQHRNVQPFDELSYLCNQRRTPVNLLCEWQTDTLSSLLQRRTHSKYIQSSIAGKPAKTKKHQDEDEEAADDDDDMEFDRPTVLDFRLPRATTQFAESLMKSSNCNSPQLLYFAMNEGELSLPLGDLRLGDAELKRICDAMQFHYLCADESGAFLTRDLSDIDVSGNNIQQIEPLRDTLILHRGLPVRSMLRTINLSRNMLSKTSVVSFLDALCTASDEVHLSSLFMSGCGLDDSVAETLATVVAKMASLTHLDVSQNSFADASAVILQAARFHLGTLSVGGINLRGCDAHIGRLLHSEKIRCVDFSDCNLDDNDALAIGEALVTASSRTAIRKLNLQHNPRMSTKAVKFIFECCATVTAEPSCSLTHLLLQGCGPIGIHEIDIAAHVAQHCHKLDALSFSVIEEEEAAVQVIVDTIVKHSKSLTSLVFDCVARPSRCDRRVSSVASARANVEVLSAHLAANKARQDARLEQAAGRSLLSSTVIDVAAEAARAVPLMPSPVSRHYLRVDDSVNRALYEAQSTSSNFDAYRLRKWQESLQAAGGSDAQVAAGFLCGTVDTFDKRWRHFCDAVVTLDALPLPKFLRSLPSFHDGVVVVSDAYEASTDLALFMIGCGARMGRSDAPFPLSANSGVHWAFMSEILLPRLRRNVIRLLCPEIVAHVLRRDYIGDVLRQREVSAYILRQKLMEALSAPNIPLAVFLREKRVKETLDEICRRLDELHPAPYQSLTCAVASEDQLLLHLAARGVDMSVFAIPSTDPTKPVTPPPPAAKKGELQKKDASQPAAAPAPSASPPPAPREVKYVGTSHHVIVEALLAM